MTYPAKISKADYPAIERAWLYVIGNDAFPGVVKVGISTNVVARLASYQTSAPGRDFYLVWAGVFERAEAVEGFVHAHWSAAHEWVKTNEVQELVDWLVWRQQV